MTDIAEFLLARIAEDEEVARAATDFGTDKWATDDLGRWLLGGDSQPMTYAEATHIARHDPARVLAECEARRRIVSFYLGSRDALASMPDGPDPQQMLKRMVGEAINESHADALKPLALPYADHPDYRQEWKP